MRDRTAILNLEHISLMNDNTLQNGISAALFSALPEPFFVFDREGRYQQIFGGADTQKYHDGRHLVGKRIHDVIDTGLADVFVAEIGKAIDSNRVHTFVYQLAATDIKGSEALPGPSGKQWFEAHISPIATTPGEQPLVVWIAFNITRLQAALAEKEALIDKLQNAIKEIKTLRGILPICAHCKKIRDDHGYWQRLETYLKNHSEADLSHGICPDCLKKHYPDIEL
ncbi:MAG: PAS domain-containing protein [Desulfofustis sp.]|nr:PAS domain-containing protein [Desulfofustis sp.]